ncbi:sporulation protein [Bacillus sp. V5-8f]|nr:sporulation protein [Bacillus sp. V5-8f]
MDDNINFTILILLGLASFRLTRLIVFDKITEFLRSPFFDEIVEKTEDGFDEVFLIPKKSGIKAWIGDLLSCYWCTGIWVSLILVALHLYGSTAGDYVIFVLAIAAIGSIIETFVSKFVGS